jgi:hypothetical protein
MIDSLIPLDAATLAKAFRRLCTRISASQAGPQIAPTVRSYLNQNA